VNGEQVRRWCSKLERGVWGQRRSKEARWCGCDDGGTGQSSWARWSGCDDRFEHGMGLWLKLG
jgi:hypothetical protein